MSATTTSIESSPAPIGSSSGATSDRLTSLDLFLASVTNSERSDYRQLFLSDTVFLNGRLAKLYDAKLASDALFEPVALNPGERCGVLTQPYIMSCFAYLKTSSPIHRGVLVTRNLLGRTLNPPPAAFVPLSADLHPNMTTRQRVSMQTKPDSCIGCHGIINPLGFTMEKFDAIGRLRTSENGQPVDCSGSYQSRSGKLVKFSGVSDLAHYLAESDESHAAFVEKLFQHMTKQPIRAYGPQVISSLQASFEKNDCSIRKLMVDSVTVAAAKK